MTRDLTDNGVENIVLKMKYNTAPGWDDVTVEHVRYGGLEIIKCLRRLYNLITKHEFIPLYFKRGIIVPIPKGVKTNYSRIIIEVSL